MTITGVTGVMMTIVVIATGITATHETIAMGTAMARYVRQWYVRLWKQRGYSRGNSGVISQTLRDLQSAASRNRVDGHERDHFNRAMSELQQMSYRSQGEIDGGRLNRVVEDLDHLSRADQIHPRDRQVLARDRQALQSLYYNRGGYNGW